MNGLERNYIDALGSASIKKRNDLSLNWSRNSKPAPSDLVNRVDKILQEAGSDGILQAFLQNQSLTDYHRAVLASQIGIGLDLPIDTIKTPDIDYVVSVLKPDKWFLCQTSEDRLRKSLNHKAVVILEPGLAVKFVGRLTAYCFENFSTVSSTFVEGNWYSPVDRELREKIESIFDQGIRRTFVKRGFWSLMRDLQDGSMATDDLKIDFKKNINGTPEYAAKPPAYTGLSTWQAFRISKREEFVQGTNAGSLIT